MGKTSKPPNWQLQPPVTTIERTIDTKFRDLGPGLLIFTPRDKILATSTKKAPLRSHHGETPLPLNPRADSRFHHPLPHSSSRVKHNLAPRLPIAHRLPNRHSSSSRNIHCPPAPTVHLHTARPAFRRFFVHGAHHVTPGASQSQLGLAQHSAVAALGAYAQERGG